jgi:hypothetical protein
MSKENNTSGGIGFTSLLLVAFIVLKLCNVISWSWWWVLSPVWIPAAIALIAYCGLGVIWLKHRKNPKVKDIINRERKYKSKWDERMEQMRAAKEKMQKSESN